MSDSTDNQQTDDNRHARAVTVAQAAAALGISENAVRLRLQRGTLARALEVGPAGEVLVNLSASRSARRHVGRRPTTDNQQTDMPSHAGVEVDVRVAVLEAQLAAANARADAAEADRDGWRQQAERLVDLMRADRVLQLQDGSVVDAAEDAAVGPADGPGRAVAPVDDDHPAGGPVAALWRFLKSLPFP